MSVKKEEEQQREEHRHVFLDICVFYVFLRPNTKMIWPSKRLQLCAIKLGSQQLIINIIVHDPPFA